MMMMMISSEPRFRFEIAMNVHIFQDNFKREKRMHFCINKLGLKMFTFQYMQFSFCCVSIIILERMGYNITCCCKYKMSPTTAGDGDASRRKEEEK